VAGWAIVFMSEATAVLFTIALSVIGQSRTQKIILMASIIGSAALALSGNYYVALHDHSVTVFSVFEAMFPPLFTLATAYVLKELMLERIQARHADQQAYEIAMIEWQAATADPEQHPQFDQAYANELRDAIIRKNRSEAAQDAMRGFTSVDWTALVQREMQTEDWFAGGETVVKLPLA
jgi:hypothetical protein